MKANKSSIVNFCKLSRFSIGTLMEETQFVTEKVELEKRGFTKLLAHLLSKSR